MDEQSQKKFLDARQRYNSAKQAWHGLGGYIRSVAEAFASPSMTNTYSGGWNQIVVAGQSVSTAPRTTRGAKLTFEPLTWPKAEQISEAWIEVNDAYREFEATFKALSPEDRKAI